MIQKSIVRKLTTWYAVSFFLIFAFGGASLYFSLTRILSNQETGVLNDHYESLVNIISTHYDPLHALSSRVGTEWAKRQFVHVYVKILDPQGKILVLTPNMPDELEREVFSRIKVGEANTPILESKKINCSSGHDYMALAKRVNRPDSAISDATLFIALDVGPEREVLARYKHNFFLILGVIFVASLMIGAKLAKFSFRPVQDIIDITKRIRSSSLDDRLDVKRLPVELKELGLTLNEMIDRMQESFHRLERFSADIAHEMRTPLNNMRGEIEVALSQDRSSSEYREVTASALEEVQRLSKMIDALLFLAKAENSDIQIKKERFNVKDELTNVMDFFEAPLSEEKISLQTEIDPGIFLNGEKTLFQRVVVNLISNAISHTPPGGKITVRGSHFDTKTRISIEDTGLGISPDDIKRVFDRFYRADSSRTCAKYTGFGLGLTIVKSIMTLYGGEVFIESELEKGTKVSLIFPEA